MIGPVDAVITLGAVVRGETSHYEIVSEESARGVQDVQLSTRSTGCPLASLTTENFAQARDRSRADETNKGREAAPHRTRDGVAPAPRIAGHVMEVLGTVESFDADRGLGVLRSVDDVALAFSLRRHCRRDTNSRRRGESQGRSAQLVAADTTRC